MDNIWGIVSLVSWAVAFFALLSAFVLGYRATTEIPRPGAERPDLEPKRIVKAGVLLIVFAFAVLVGALSGIAWIVLMFAGGAR